jgi:single-stranded-DNA-specific exonuclease
VESRRDWKLKAKDPEAIARKIEELRAPTGLSPTALRVCVQRGLESFEQIREFLSPRLESLKSPQQIRDMDRAVERLARACESGERVRIYGDYDVDGTTGAALLTWVFRDLKFSFDAAQPDRFRDGYGLGVPAVEQAAQDGIKVLVSVDCGITSFTAATRARELGIDFIVVDHHQVDPVRGLPEAVAVVNPQRADCESGLRQLCGCGLAFYVSIALRAYGREHGWFGPGSARTEPNLKQHLDLVVIATAADMVPLTGDNRILVKQGLEVLKRTSKPGVRALMEVSGLRGESLSPGDLGFALGPRINASGRLSSASHALELLSTQDEPRARELAQLLEQLNRERAEIQNQIWDQVRVRVEEGIAQGRYQNAVVVADPGWHEGVVGIVASRVTESFHRPAIVISLREGLGKGSVRSFGGKNVLEAMRAAGSHLKGFGGHAHAAGLQILPENVDAFAAAFDAAVASLPSEGGAKPPLSIEAEVELDELSPATLLELERLAPFGPGNPEPVFVVRAAVKSQTVLKGRHLKLRLGPPASPTSAMEAIWFHATERMEEFELARTQNARFAWAGVPEINRFRGRETPTLRVKDLRSDPLAPNS